MSPSLINFWIFFVLSYTYSNRKTLIIKGSRSQQQLPMKRSGRMVETSRIDQHSCTFFRHYHSQFCKSDIVAYAQAHSTVFGIKYTYGLSSTKSLGLVVAYLSWNVDVEEMSFIVLCLQLALRIYDKGSIEKLLVGFAWNASNSIHFMLGAYFFDGIECGRV